MMKMGINSLTKPNQKQNDPITLWNNFLVNLTTYRVLNFRSSMVNNNDSIGGDGSKLMHYKQQLWSDNNSGCDKEQSNSRLVNIRLMIYDLKSDGTGGNIDGVRNDTRFRKSWGNFVNLYDDRGRQKLFIELSQLTNYLALENFNNPQSPFSLYASLFSNGNYPKALYSGSGKIVVRWRMRFNMFASGLVNETHFLENNQQNEAVGDQIKTTTAIHIGELHLYFHVEQNKPEPIYQNICFFYDQSLNSMIVQNNNDEMGRLLIELYRHLRSELSSSLFIEQFFFPIERESFHNPDSTVDYFLLRQQDLNAAIKITNLKACPGGLRASFLH